jgi:Ni/Co efflux regulator RcnB
MVLRLVLTVALALSAAAADAQQARKPDGGRERPMSQEERQRMRDDVRDAYRERQDRPQKARQQQMSPEERDRLRRDIEDANKNLKR